MYKIFRANIWIVHLFLSDGRQMNSYTANSLKRRVEEGAATIAVSAPFFVPAINMQSSPACRFYRELKRLAGVLLARLIKAGGMDRHGLISSLLCSPSGLPKKMVFVLFRLPSGKNIPDTFHYSP